MDSGSIRALAFLAVIYPSGKAAMERMQIGLVFGLNAAGVLDNPLWF
jgi:hypothetical protein